MAKKRRGSTASKKNRLWLGKRVQAGRLIALLALAGALAVAGGALLERVSASGGADASVSLRISELMSENRQTLITDTGDVPDWIEIVNTGDERVSLDGWTLILDSNLNHPFSLPRGELGPGEYALVYASGDTRTGRWNAPFRLNASGGDTLALLGPGGAAVDTVTLPELQADESYQRGDDGAWTISREPSPGGDQLGGCKLRRWSKTRAPRWS